MLRLRHTVPLIVSFLKGFTFKVFDITLNILEMSSLRDMRFSYMDSKVNGEYFSSTT